MTWLAVDAPAPTIKASTVSPRPSLFAVAPDQPVSLALLLDVYAQEVRRQVRCEADAVHSLQLAVDADRQDKHPRGPVACPGWPSVGARHRAAARAHELEAKQAAENAATARSLILRRAGDR
jgi:hypothetical protein